MTNLKHLTLSLLVTQVLAATSFAQSVLFIDANNAPKEIQSVKQGLMNKNQSSSTITSVSVVPTTDALPLSVRAEIEKTYAQQLKVQNDMGIMNDQQKDSAYDQIALLGRTHTELLNGYDKGLLAQEIKTKITSPIDILIVSGHHENGYIGEELVPFNADFLRNTLKENPEIYANVKFLFIFGCNSGQESIIRRWAEVVPSATMVIASNGVAPTKDNPRNLYFIKNLIRQTRALANGQPLSSTIQAKSFLKKIKFYGWPAAMLWKFNPESAGIYLK